ATVYLKHDQHFGACYLHATDQVTPNMPKLRYAINFEVREDKLEIKDSLNSELAKYKEAYVFEKRDGFNLLFYKFRDKVIPKTRTAPIALGQIQKVIQLPEFPIKQIEQMVLDGFTPYFEVWGTKLDEFEIIHGCVNILEVQKAEGLPDLNCDLIAVKQDNKWLSPDRMFQLAKQYDLEACKCYDIVEVSVSRVIDLMQRAEQLNEKVGTIITEGYVLHAYTPRFGLGMFKVKPYNVMLHDVIRSHNTIPKDRVDLEISKLLLEYDLISVAKDPIPYLEMLYDYLEEDYKLTNKAKRRVLKQFTSRIARLLISEHNISSAEQAGRSGIHKCVIGALIQLLK
ncbi:hypothetical protein DRH29_04865, partial [candidate division Kazan bacterium]